MIRKTVTSYEVLHICDSARVSEYHKRLCRETQHRTMYLLIERKCWITQPFLLGETLIPNIVPISLENCELWGTNDIPEPVFFISTFKQLAELAIPSLLVLYSSCLICIYILIPSDTTSSVFIKISLQDKKLNRRFPWHSWKHREIVRTFSYTALRDEPREGNLKPELYYVLGVRNYSICTTEKYDRLCGMPYWYQN
jgi:hypothetical protein